MLPGFLLMLALAWAYTKLTLEGTWLGALFLGVQAAVLAVILRAVHRIGEHILINPALWVAAALSAAASAAGVSFWIVLPAAGVIYALAAERRHLLAGLAFATAPFWRSCFGPAGRVRLPRPFSWRRSRQQPSLSSLLA
jgi:chromate transporter